MPYKKKEFNIKTAGNLAFSQTGSHFVYACMRSGSENEREEKRGQTTVRAVIFACEWVFWSAYNMMTSVTGSNISLP